jgi:hypothetical protein
MGCEKKLETPRGKRIKEYRRCGLGKHGDSKKHKNNGKKKNRIFGAVKHGDDQKHKIFKWKRNKFGMIGVVTDGNGKNINTDTQAKTDYRGCGVVKDGNGKKHKNRQKTNTEDTEWCSKGTVQKITDLFKKKMNTDVAKW